jgi:hypothetical protein
LPGDAQAVEHFQLLRIVIEMQTIPAMSDSHEGGYEKENAADYFHIWCF